MTISASLKPLDLRDELEAANMKGKNLTFLDDYSKEELGHLFKAAELLEPYSKNQIPLLANKLLYTLFFQPSTRTRCSHEVAMHRLGGRVITETDPMGHSAMAKNESLYDGIRVISQYADVLVLRHGDSEQVLATLERLGSDACPIISGGYGHVTHPTQGLLDMYTALRALKKPFEDMRIIISTPDLSRARSGQSFALGAARMGAHIIYTGSSGLRTPQVLIDKLKSMGASFEEHFDLTHDEKCRAHGQGRSAVPARQLPEEGRSQPRGLHAEGRQPLSVPQRSRIHQEEDRARGRYHAFPAAQRLRVRTEPR